MGIPGESWLRRCNSNPIINLSTDGSTESWLQACRSDPDRCSNRDRGRQSSNGDPVLPSELVWEILTWLPAKSLMRFKCVSRLWRSIIQDPNFANAHRGGFRGLLIHGRDSARLLRDIDFYYLSIHNSRVELSHHLTVGHGGKWFGSTDVINGLVCFYNRNNSYLYNITTREKLQLPVSRDDSETTSYHLGFDSVNKVYKLLKICPVYEDYIDGDIWEHHHGIFVQNLNCEILTIGVDSSWRSIDFPPWEIRSRSICCNGALLWLEDEAVGHTQHLIAFSLAEEKFRSIFRPRWGRGLLLCFGNRPTVVTTLYKKFRLAAEIYECGDSGVWTQFDLIFPKSGECDDFAPIGTLPDGKILVSRYVSANQDKFPTIYYLYNPAKRRFKKILILESPAPEKTIDGYMSYHEENIMPLNCLNLLI